MPVVLIALLDLGHQPHEHRKRLRMSRRELKEELKQTEGDPMIESRLRALRQERARRRMMAEVPKATVAVTNPTHVAVALRYDQEIPPAPYRAMAEIIGCVLRLRGPGAGRVPDPQSRSVNP